MTIDALLEIEAIGPPLVAVSGNMDPPDLSPPRNSHRGHSRGRDRHRARRRPAAGRIGRLRERFPDAAAVVFGHSHMPLHEQAGDFQIFNPGSPTDRRRAPAHSMGLATVDRGSISFELVPLPR